jgi:hypothetical protein
MEKEFIPYEHSLEMKSIEFDELCFGWYHDNTLEFDVKSNETIELHKLLGRFKNCCLAPTFSQSFRWFRDKHGLHSIIDITIEDKWYFSIFNLNEKRNSEIETIEFYFDKYEHAEFVCLNKLIEIIKKSKQ